ncbi:Metallo-beta-lactamase superfamily protein [Novacetimonas maltaceti]|uniref:Metallo-beta-lactamase superfamily protein n=2 Tax=Acetobacteraceae TaxID=433 RepID=A0A2S3VY00_9PROT|nr:Metallo-beta-lactamase superfamily protein [Novacetimonas maltaceti]
MSNRNAWKVYEPPPPKGEPLCVTTGIRRIVTTDCGPMTYHGTNTWLIQTETGTIVIDPGSDHPGHINSILNATGGNIEYILITHWHADHYGGARELQEQTGAPVAVHKNSLANEQLEIIRLEDGDVIGGLQAIGTPGHTLDHICFATQNGVLFTGDHIMGWSTSVVPPAPEGNLRLYMESLKLVLSRKDALLLPAHGPPLHEPQLVVRALLCRRIERLDEIRALLTKRPLTLDALALRAYRLADKHKHEAVRLTLLSHLEELARLNIARCVEEAWYLN